MPLTDVEIKKAKYSSEDGKPERLTDAGGICSDLPLFYSYCKFSTHHTAP